ncbi:unnamed protein product [Effrenium voratum]|uniref:Serine/threonine-protein kinase BSK1-like TPR repeats domain-containing protein n=1 Tax=Effrenium voratum TaxID=2562239 RepID=A0AA36NKN0_9DINO|nr:unnamed protein product [Effrenium voratum]
MEMCESKELKAQADQAFRNQDFQMAIALYSQALVWAPSETLLSNRSAAYAAAGNFKAALEDAKSCEEMAPDWPKAVFRRGVALRGLKRYDMAISAFAQGQDQDPSNPNWHKEIEETERMRELQRGGRQRSYQLSELPVVPSEIANGQPSRPVTQLSPPAIITRSDQLACFLIAAFTLLSVACHPKTPPDAESLQWCQVLGTKTTIEDIVKHMGSSGMLTLHGECPDMARRNARMPPRCEIHDLGGAVPLPQPSRAHEVDGGQRLLNLVPTPTWECGKKTAKVWEAGYALSPATENWSRHVREAHRTRSALAVGFVGATSAGKSWLVSKLQSEGAAQPARFEQSFSEGVDLQSMTSDINLYMDPVDHIYYVDFEGTYGTLPLQYYAADMAKVVQRCADVTSWESRRRQVLKESFQPAIAYLMCDVVVFLTREKLVCRRALEECEQFARAANARVTNALPPALIIVQNCCRPSEGLFDSDKCTEAFRRAHFSAGRWNYDEPQDAKPATSAAVAQWAEYFRSIDCFCVPDEYTFCKRSGFDGEDVCKEVIAKLKATIRTRLSEGEPPRAVHGISLSQFQWFAALSTLCSIINDQETVAMSAIYIHAGAVAGGVDELKSVLLQLMHPMKRLDVFDATDFHRRLGVALGVIARFVVRHDMSEEDVRQVVRYIVSLFPCGAVAPPTVERADGSKRPVVCAQNQLFHQGLHRSNVLVRTVDAGWFQHLSEWLQGGVTYAWPGEFSCSESVAEASNQAVLTASILEQVEEYKVAKCLEGLAPKVGTPWVLKAHGSFSQSGLKVLQDSSRLCIVCTDAGSDTGSLWKFWTSSANDLLPVCAHCYQIMESNGLCKGSTIAPAAQANCGKEGRRCAACAQQPGRVIMTEDRLLTPTPIQTWRGCAAK